MRIETIRTLAGPNVHHHKPVLVMTLDVEDLADIESHAISGFNERLIELLPGLHEHRCRHERRGEVVRTEEEAIDALDHIGVPVVVKPLDGRQGKGVSLNISTPEQMKQAFALAQEFSEKVLVEELFVGKNYRVLVIGNRMVAASERMPAHVTGDGEPVERSEAGKPGGGIIELNAAPGLRMHLYPSEGKPRDVGGAIIRMLYPGCHNGRIPIISITGTNGKTTFTRMIGHVLSQIGRHQISYRRARARTAAQSSWSPTSWHPSRPVARLASDARRSRTRSRTLATKSTIRVARDSIRFEAAMCWLTTGITRMRFMPFAR